MTLQSFASSFLVFLLPIYLLLFRFLLGFVLPLLLFWGILAPFEGDHGLPWDTLDLYECGGYKPSNCVECGHSWAANEVVRLR